ncbi:MAG: hypothetical protein FWG72_07015 [Oscillospiraceae bacterium]|nr:hypothetical protein [Oscillospiraceae bacterium]
MTQAHQILFDEIARLPIEKVGKAISFVRYLEQEPEQDLFIAPEEEDELLEILTSGDFARR